MKRVIQVYKPNGWWKTPPPGFGDFVRGTCHLFELVKERGGELKIDISKSEFSELIDQDPLDFVESEPELIKNADEFFQNNQSLDSRLNSFFNSTDQELYICTNTGEWNRTQINEETKLFAQKLYKFNNRIYQFADKISQEIPYAIMHIRCGDLFMESNERVPQTKLVKKLYKIIRKRILLHTNSSVIVIGDCHKLNLQISKDFGLKSIEHAPAHAGSGSALSSAVDLQLIKHATKVYHINAWRAWWSGFSHYTAITHNIPIVHLIYPYFSTEHIDSAGNLKNTENLDSLMFRLKVSTKRILRYFKRLYSAN